MTALSGIFEVKPNGPVDLSDRAIHAQILCPREDDVELLIPVHLSYARKDYEILLLNEQHLWERLFAFSESLDPQSVRQLELALRALQEFRREKGLSIIGYEQDMINFDTDDVTVICDLKGALEAIYESSPLYRVHRDKGNDHDPGLRVA